MNQVLDRETFPPISVTWFFRHPVAGWHSMEELFACIRSEMSPRISVKVVVLDHPSRGIVCRLRNIFQAFRERGEINHITGDVHYIALGLPRRHLILTVLDLGILNNTGSVRRWTYKVFWYKIPVGRAARVTTISHFTANSLATLLPDSAQKTVVIENPVGRDLLSAYESQEIPKRRATGGRARVLCVGTTSNKNLLRILEAVEGLDLELHIVGHLDENQCQTAEDLKVEYRNYRDLSRQQIVDLYRDSDLLLFPSLFEGFGMPIIEAQAMGVPVITSAREPMASISGEAALLVDPESPHDIRRAILRLLASPELQDQLIEAGRCNVQRFNPKRAADGYEAIYGEMESRNGN